MKKIWIIIGIIILIIIVFVLSSKKPAIEESQELGNTNTTSVEIKTSLPETKTPVTTMNSSAKDVSFSVSGGNFYFKPNIIKVKEGDTVTITFKNDGGMHDFKIDEYDIASGAVASGAEKQITFVASKKGSFEYYCSIGKHREMGMKGTLIVE